MVRAAEAPAPRPPDVGDPARAGSLRRAEAARLAGRLNEADGIALDLLAETPGLVGAIAVRAAVAAQRGEEARAVAWLEELVAAAPDPTLLCLLASLHRRAFRADRALDCAGRAVALARGAARLEPLLELARVRVDRGENDRAAEAFLAAIAQDPGHAGAHLGLGQVLLADGAYAPGWIEYEWRDRLPEAAGRIPPIRAAAWNGMALPGKRLLVVCDQGFGDAIQFARFLPEAAARVGDLAVACSPELRALFAGIGGVATCVERWADIPGFSAWAAISSLPGILEVRADAIPAPVPYLAASERCRAMRERLEASGPGRPRVGLVWSGRPTHPNDARRSLPLARLAPVLARLRGAATIVSLQRERGEADAAALAEAGATDLADALGDFEDTAAALVALDLVITVDSAVAHLAGALGRPTWVLTPTPADWRWGRARADTPWYPSLLLFRQPVPGDWDAAIASVVASLDAEFGTRPGG